MNTFLPAYGVQNTTSPIIAGGKVAGNYGAAGQADVSTAPFGTLFSSALENVQQADAIKNNDSNNLSIADVDDLGELMVNSVRAQTAFELLVEMRNKVLDSYQEIMRMSI